MSPSQQVSCCLVASDSHEQTTLDPGAVLDPADIEGEHLTPLAVGEASVHTEKIFNDFKNLIAFTYTLDRLLLEWLDPICQYQHCKCF